MRLRKGMVRKVGGPFGRPVLKARPFPRIKLGRRGIPAIARDRKRG